MRILIGINTLSHVHNNVYSSHLGLLHRIGKLHPDWSIELFTPLRMSIDRMRNTAAKMAIEHKCDYLFFIDDDVLVPPDALDKLIEADADVAAGWTVIRGYPFNNMFFRWADSQTLEHYNEFDTPTDGILEVGAVGFSCALLRVSALQRVEAPYFVTGPYSTEDVYYCIKLQQAVPDARLIVRTDLHTGHMMECQIVEPANRLSIKAQTEEMYPGLLEPQAPAAPIQEPQPETDALTYEDVLKKELFHE